MLQNITKESIKSYLDWSLEEYQKEMIKGRPEFLLEKHKEQIIGKLFFAMYFALIDTSDYNDYAEILDILKREN